LCRRIDHEIECGRPIAVALVRKHQLANLVPRAGACSGAAGTTIANEQRGLMVSLVRKRAVGDALMSMAALLVLIATLALIDDRVRDQISRSLAPGQPSAQVAQAGATLRGLSSVVFVAVRDQSIEHAPMVTFVLAGTVLLVFMLRT
jgi:hypothetical protein